MRFLRAAYGVAAVVRMTRRTVPPLLALFILAGLPAHADIRVIKRTLVSSTVVNSTATDYTYAVQVTNHGDAATHVTATVTSYDPAATVTSGNLNFPDIAAGATSASLNTYTIRHAPTAKVNDNLIRLAFSAISKPVANAGPDQLINALNAYYAVYGDTSSSPHCCLLNARGSYDPFGRRLTYSWKLVSKPQGSATTDPSPSVVSLLVPDVPGDYVLQLTVNNGALTSDPSTVTLSTVAVPPMADAGRDQTAKQGQAVQLDGTQSVNAMARPITYSWAFVSSPTPHNPSLSDPRSPRPTFTVGAPGTYRVQLQVTDGPLTSKPSVVTINTTNTPPHADAGPDMKIALSAANAEGLLFGNRSTDVDGDFLTYRWFFLSGYCTLVTDPICATLLNPEPNPLILSFRAAHIQLMVSDGYSESIGTVLVSDYPLNGTFFLSNFDFVLPAIPASSSVGSLPISYTLDASPSARMIYDSTLTASWSLLYRPPGSAATVSDSAMTTTLTPDVSGLYVAQLKVKDWGYWSAPTAIAAATHREPPVAVPGPTQWLTWTGPVVITVNGSASSDPDRHPLTYRWSLLSKPLGSTAVLSTSTVVAPTFTADVNGSYVVQLIVNDGISDSLPATVSVITKVNSKPIAVDSDTKHPWKFDCNPVTIYGGDKETDFAKLALEIVTQPQNGFLSDISTPTYADVEGYMYGSVSLDTALSLDARYGIDPNGGFTWGARTLCYVSFSPTFTGTDSFTYRVVDNGLPAGCGAASSSCQAPKASDPAIATITIFEI